MFSQPWSRMDFFGRRTTNMSLQSKLLRISEVEAIAGIKKSFIYREIRAGSFPAPLKITAKMSRWNASDIEEWIERQIRTKSRRCGE